MENTYKKLPNYLYKVKINKNIFKSFVSQEQLINLGLIIIEKEFPSFDVKKDVV